MSLSSVAEHKHDHSPDQELAESALGDLVADCGQDEVELDHLQWHCDGPVDVAVKNWGCVDQHPELTHVEVVHGGNQGNKGTHVHGCLPMSRHCGRLHEEEHSRCHHGDGDDPEGDGDGVIWVQESVQVQSHGDAGETWSENSRRTACSFSK